ncbi:MAG: UDP-3-O-(3-hydroxymyristoyl)glucosamine N-acyltransferase [Planctomycetes bacterium]|nr:UDP-3-O-(3-hydroxymyristoyl)glucosamine N-acyltransferase [Planctomycetota bacterium]
MSQERTLTVAELARCVEGVVEGDGTRIIRTLAPLGQAGADAVSWLGNPSYLPRLAESRAGAVIVPAECVAPPGRTVIRVDDPDLAMCAALAALAPPPDTVPEGVDPTAVLSAGVEVAPGAAVGAHVYLGPQARVGAGTMLYPGVYVGAHVAIGRGCVLWPNVVVREYATIGDRVIIHPNVTLGADGFGYLQRAGRHVKIPQIGRVVIEDDVEIGANSAVDRARSGVTRIRRGTKIDNLVQVGHNVEVGEDCLIVAQSCMGGSAELGQHVVLAVQAGVSDHVRLGDGVQVAAQSAVMRDFSAGRVLRGTPATDHTAFARQQIGLRRLPKLIEQMRALARRVEELESATDDTERG